MSPVNTQTCKSHCHKMCHRKYNWNHFQIKTILTKHNHLFIYIAQRSSTFRMKFSSGCRRSSLTDWRTAFSRVGSRFLGTSSWGNRSLISPRKMGTSLVTSFGRLKSLSARISTWRENEAEQILCFEAEGLVCKKRDVKYSCFCVTTAHLFFRSAAFLPLQWSSNNQDWLYST